MIETGYYNMDCMDGMAQMPDKYIDLAIVDPPYGIGASAYSYDFGDCQLSPQTAYKKRYIDRFRDAGVLGDRALNKMQTEWDREPPDESYFRELMRVSKNQIIWGGNYFDLPPTRGIVCWDKEQPFENFSGWEMAWTSFDKPAKIFHYSNAGFQRKDKDIRIHPTQKPVALYKWLLKNYAQEGDIILDTHVGSASSLIACEQMGFKYIGFEIDEGYYRQSKERLDTFNAQIRFDFSYVEIPNDPLLP